MKVLKGICTPVFSTFNEDGSSIDEETFVKHLDRVINAGVDIVCINGGTGEFPYLSIAERKRLAELAVQHVQGRAQVLIHTSSTRTEEAVEMAQHAEQVGADAILLLPPFFEGPGEDGVFEFYEKVADAINIPIMAYNIPVFSGFDITPEFYQRLCTIENIKALKDSTADMLRLHQLLAIDANVFCGADHIQLDAMLAGCPGIFWGGSNVFPEKAVQLNSLVKQGEFFEANKLWKTLVPLCVFFWEGNYISKVKAAANFSSMEVGISRPPQQPISEVEAAGLKMALSRLV